MQRLCIGVVSPLCCFQFKTKQQQQQQQQQLLALGFVLALAFAQLNELFENFTFEAFEHLLV